MDDELRVVDDPGRLQGGRLSGLFLSQVISTGVQIVAIPWLTGSAVAKAVVVDAAVSVGCQEKHLVFEGIGIEGPAVAEHDRLPAFASPILVVVRGSVADRNGSRHVSPPLGCLL
jgi:hypothetical protein